MTDKKSINKFNVREISVNDTERLADYWSNLTNEEAFRIGIDTDEIPNKSTIIEMLNHQIAVPNSDKNTFILIWELDGVPIGHSNITPIVTNDFANIHFHIWDRNNWKSGLGEKYIRLSIPIFFEQYSLNRIYGVFHTNNIAAEKLFQKLGFTLADEYETRPGDWSLYQSVKKYVLNKEDFKSII